MVSATHFKLSKLHALRKTAGSGFNTNGQPTYASVVPSYLSARQKEKMVMTASGKTMNLMPKPQQSRSIATHIDNEVKK